MNYTPRNICVYRENNEISDQPKALIGKYNYLFQFKRYTAKDTQRYILCHTFLGNYPAEINTSSGDIDLNAGKVRVSLSAN